jgi:hypothetical protein
VQIFAESGDVEVSIYDLTGRKMETLIHPFQSEGGH